MKIVSTKTKPVGGGTHSRFFLNSFQKTSKDLLRVVGLTSAIVLATTTSSFAEDSSANKGNIYVGANMATGFGFKDDKIGTATNGDDITLSAGGGFGGSLYIGYVINPTFDVELSVGKQTSSMTPVSNATGDFSRNTVLLSILMKKQVAGKHNLKFGGGFGTYSGAKLEMTFDDINLINALKYEQEYESATGVHVMLQDEFEINPSLYFVGGAKAYSVSYKEKKTFVVDGRTIDNTEVETVDGGGIDLMIGIVKYF